jgi:hypothetical protein
MTWLVALVIRPLAIARAAWLILRVFRVRHPASQHAVWSAVLTGLALLAPLSVIAPRWSARISHRRSQRRRQAVGAIFIAMRRVRESDDVVVPVTASLAAGGRTAGGMAAMAGCDAAVRAHAYSSRRSVESCDGLGGALSVLVSFVGVVDRAKAGNAG